MNRLFAITSLLLGACSLSLGSGCKGKTADAAVVPIEGPAVSVQVEAPLLVEVPRTLRLTGTLKGDRETDLAANANGRVLATSVERGDAIKPGQVLAKLDVRAASLSAAEARAQVDSSRAQQEQAQLECDRYEKLKARGAVTDLEYQQKITQCRTLPLALQAANARAALAAQNVGDGVIRAPFAGVVSERYVEVGQFLRQDSRVVTIVALDPMRVEMSVPEAEVGKIQQGAELSFAVAAYPDRRFTAAIRFVSASLRTNTRDLVVEAVVANPDRALRPGMFADVSLTVGRQKLPSVPKGALVSRDGQAHAFVVVAGHLEERILALGPELGERVSVTQGVGAADQVVVSDPAKLENGQKVR